MSVCINAAPPFQGSILGPSLFINDLPAIIRSRLGIYADLKTIYPCLSIKSDRSYKVKLVDALENDLQSGVNNSKECTVNFNASKSKLLTFNPYREPFFLLSTSMAGINLQRATLCAFLGLLFLLR